MRAPRTVPVELTGHPHPRWEGQAPDALALTSPQTVLTNVSAGAVLLRAALCSGNTGART